MAGAVRRPSAAPTHTLAAGTSHNRPTAYIPAQQERTRSRPLLLCACLGIARYALVQKWPIASQQDTAVHRKVLARFSRES
jgi:hypothetical protein